MTGAALRPGVLGERLDALVKLFLWVQILGAGTIIAVTVLSLLLVLVASGIGAFVLLDTSNGGSNLTTGTAASTPRRSATGSRRARRPRRDQC